jgi:hypothetical protein
MTANPGFFLDVKEFAYRAMFNSTLTFYYYSMPVLPAYKKPTTIKAHAIYKFPLDRCYNDYVIWQCLGGEGGKYRERQAVHDAPYGYTEQYLNPNPLYKHQSSGVQSVPVEDYAYERDLL